MLNIGSQLPNMGNDNFNYGLQFENIGMQIKNIGNQIKNINSMNNYMKFHIHCSTKLFNFPNSYLNNNYEIYDFF